MPNLKQNVSIRVKSSAFQRLTAYHALHPEMSEVEIATSALNLFFDGEDQKATAQQIPSDQKTPQPEAVT